MKYRGFNFMNRIENVEEVESPSSLSYLEEYLEEQRIKSIILQKYHTNRPRTKEELIGVINEILNM